MRNHQVTMFRPSRKTAAIVVVLLACQALLLTWSAACHSPVIDEPGSDAAFGHGSVPCFVWRRGLGLGLAPFARACRRGLCLELYRWDSIARKS